MSYSRYVGRVGGLAVALGIGAAIGQACAVASADDTGAGSSRQHSQAGSGANKTGPRLVTPRVPTQKVAAPPRIAKARAAVSPSVPPGTVEPVLLTVAQSGRQRFGAKPASALSAASTPTGTWNDVITNHYDRIYQPGMGYYTDEPPPYGEEGATGILDLTAHYSADGYDVLATTFRYTAQTWTAQVWSWPDLNVVPHPSTELDMYLVKFDPTSYAIVGVHVLAPGSFFTVADEGVSPYSQYVGIAVIKDTTIEEFDGVPDIPAIKPPDDPGDPGDDEDPDGLTPPVLTIREIKAHSVELVPDKDGSEDARVVGYNIYRDGVKVNDKVVSTIFVFTDEDLQADKTYIYTARSVDEYGNESAESNKVPVTTHSDPGFLNRLRDKVVDIVVPDENGQNSPLEVLFETTRNLVSIVPVVGALFAAITIPVDLVQLIIASINGDRADMKDEATDLARDLVSALGIFNSLRFLKAVADSV
jgi:hypothetical protein